MPCPMTQMNDLSGCFLSFLGAYRAFSKRELVAEVEFAEWTADDHLRLARFVAIREDKSASSKGALDPPAASRHIC